jgi:hypothetical protein
MKLGASLGTEGGYLRSVAETARAAETLGFAGLWTSETKHDAFLQLAIAANETEKIELGTSVAIAFSAVLPRAILWGDKDVAWGCVVRLRSHDDGGWAEVRARAEGPYALRRH